MTATEPLLGELALKRNNPDRRVRQTPTGPMLEDGCATGPEAYQAPSTLFHDPHSHPLTTTECGRAPPMNRTGENL
jgi:hypothetical protein